MNEKQTQTIEQLTRRFKELDKERTKVQTLLDSAKNDLEHLLAEAEEKYGTREIEQLQKRLAELKNENLKLRQKYQQELDGVESKLANIASEPNDGQIQP